MEIDIFYLSEIRQPRVRDLWSSKYRLIHIETTDNKPVIRGVDIIMDKATGKKVKRFMQYNKRIILVKIETKHKDSILVHVYMPTFDSSKRQIK